DDLVIASFTSGPGATTLPMRIYSQVRLGVTPEINAVCTILVALVTIGVIVASLATKRSAVAGRERLLNRPAGRGKIRRRHLRRRGDEEGRRRARALDERVDVRQDGRVVPAAADLEREA